MSIRALVAGAFLLSAIPSFAGRDIWTPLPVPKALPSYPVRVVADPTDADVVYARGVLGSYRSSNGGLAWARITFESSESPCSSPGVTAVDPLHASILYAACGDDFPNPAFGKLLRSEDGGRSWRIVLESQTVIGAVAVAGNSLFAVEQLTGELHPPVYSATLAASGTGGLSWAESFVGTIDVNDLAAVPGDPPTLLSSWLSNEPLPIPPQHGGVLRSTDAGATWMPGAGLPDEPAGPIAVDPFDTAHVVVSAGVPPSPSHLHESRDGGASWTPVGSIFGNGITSLVFDALVPGRVFAATLGGGVLVSTDAGTTWATLNEGLTDRNVYSLAASGDRLYAGTGDGSLFRFDFVRLQPVPIPQSPPALIRGRGNLAQSGVWGSSLASLATTGGGATLQILAGDCYGSYGTIGAPIPRGPFALAGTYTQLIGAYPGMIQYDATFSGSVTGNQMVITVEVPALQESFGPFDLTYGVLTSWEPCRYPGPARALRLSALRH